MTLRSDFLYKLTENVGGNFRHFELKQRKNKSVNLYKSYLGVVSSGVELAR